MLAIREDSQLCFSKAALADGTKLKCIHGFKDSRQNSELHEKDIREVVHIKRK